MKIICAPDSFKESLTAVAAAEAMARGVRRALPDAEVDVCPISDGGEGFVEAMLAAMPGQSQAMTSAVMGPLGENVNAGWGVVDTEQLKSQPCARTAIIEMAAASGLELVPTDRRNPIKTTTFGTGQLIHEAIAKHRCQRILIGIGGSATCDGGCGMAQALGVRFLDADQRAIGAPFTGGNLQSIAKIDLKSESFTALLREAHEESQITVACDVTNPLTGFNGSAHVYGPQKGATGRQVEQLDGGLYHLAEICRVQLGIDHEFTSGAGAAGGLGFGLLAFLSAQLQSGIELVLDALHFDERLRDANLVLTGEGKLDGQSLAGKACIGVAQRSKLQSVPTIALVGTLGDDVEQVIDAGLDGYELIGEGLPLEQSLREAGTLLERAAERVCVEKLKGRLQG